MRDTASDPLPEHPITGPAPDASSDESPAAVPSAGFAASAWALVRATAGVAGAPLGIPTLALASRRTQRAALGRIDRFDEHLRAVASGAPSPLPAPRRTRVDSDRPIVITSDLHRSVAGRIDRGARQRSKDVYRWVLSDYADRGWTLIENGDVEDFWLTGGSTWGTVYDVGRLAGAIPRQLADEPRRDLQREHLDRIVDNNAAVYELLRDGFCADGRYLRTMGNHDDSYDDPAICEHLATHLPGVEVVDTVLVSRPGCGDGDGIGGVDAVVMHGHLTDAWNGPGFAFLGRAITWFATSFDDLPGLGDAVDGLPDEEAVSRLLTGHGRNRLITLDPRYGGNRRFDSLDEQRLFERLGRTAPPGGWPWLVFGHTHFPMLRPVGGDGRAVRYANSGCGLLDRAFSAVEWDPERGEPRLVLWLDEPTRPRRVEMVPDGARLRVLDGGAAR